MKNQPTPSSLPDSAPAGYKVETFTTDSPNKPSVLLSCLQSGDWSAFDKLDHKTRIKQLEEVGHRLQFECRLALLAPNQLKAMRDKSLNVHQQAQLKSCQTEEGRKVLFRDFARLQHIKDCAWSDYLHGVIPNPPVSPDEQSN